MPARKPPALDPELDEALEETFPSSDPIAVHDPELKAKRAARQARPARKKSPMRKPAGGKPRRR